MKPADFLEGLDLPGGWRVDSIRRMPPTSTGGQFSVGYLVVNNDGRRAHLKALDFSSAFNSPDHSRVLQAMTTAYNFERDLLNKCKKRKLSHVVTPLADGTIKVPGVPGNFGPLCNVCYLIFDLAKGDIRNEVQEWKQFDLAWTLRSLHHTAIGLRQLHSTGIAHQDLKPSNVLVFPDIGSKVSDLGCASDVHTPSQVDNHPIPGDRGYCPPEQWYGYNPPNFSTRLISDLYLLGSLIFFFFMTCSVTHAIWLKISQMHVKKFSISDFFQDLPYIQHAFADTLGDLRATIKRFAGDLTDEIVTIAKQLCEPDPHRRGDPRVLLSRVPQYDLQPYISRFDRLARRAELKIL